MEIAEENRRLRAGDDQNQKHEKQETKHVVHLIRPRKKKN